MAHTSQHLTGFVVTGQVETGIGFRADWSVTNIREEREVAGGA